MANIKQIAELSGVSVTTVSRVLNNHPYVSREKREAVLEVVRRLNYSQNVNAVHLVRGRTQMIGILLPYMNQPFFSSFMKGLADEALKHQYNLIFFQSDYREQEELRAMDMLKMKQIDGLIIVSKAVPWHVVEEYAAYGPIVAFEDTGEQAISSVSFDHYNSYMHALDYFIKRGHRHIGLTLAREHSFNSGIRKRAFRDALERIGEHPRQEWMFYQCYDISKGAEVIRSLAGLKERPTAMLVSGDEIAAGMMLEGRRLGIRVPDDLSIISCENLPLADALELTALGHRNEEAGSLMFQVCYRKIINPAEETEKHKLPFQFVERASVKLMA
ncbi:LacI family DNA-binding transcriptional regulator [Paenibacillus apiarius]|uniref:LacI family DNA-binding transcriptional regulator n=1 Tax=Paenibacillus apiarius TaxID=46240 RepID=UPI00198109DC|nr:LacI family DNA-binding transcriptional regulator [Paenibacillus apiarius]MBN3522847.1 LacI family DNA-binding transcriptional regulator [Paenibacillus apiarius]